MKAGKPSRKDEDDLVPGCDRILARQDAILSKPKDLQTAREHSLRLRGGSRHPYSSAVIFEHGRPVWRHVGAVRLAKRRFSDSRLEAHLERNWPRIAGSVAGYKLEEEGVRLFSRIQGDYFCVPGMPFLEILAYLGSRGLIET